MDTVHIETSRELWTWHIVPPSGQRPRNSIAALGSITNIQTDHLLAFILICSVELLPRTVTPRSANDNEAKNTAEVWWMAGVTINATRTRMLPHNEEMTIAEIMNTFKKAITLLESWSLGGTKLSLLKASRFWDFVKLSINSRVSLKKSRSLSKFDRFIFWKECIWLIQLPDFYLYWFLKKDTCSNPIYYLKISSLLFVSADSD